MALETMNEFYSELTNPHLEKMHEIIVFKEFLLESMLEITRIYDGRNLLLLDMQEHHFQGGLDQHRGTSVQSYSVR